MGEREAARGQAPLKKKKGRVREEEKSGCGDFGQVWYIKLCVCFVASCVQAMIGGARSGGASQDIIISPGLFEVAIYLSIHETFLSLKSEFTEALVLTHD